MELLPILTGALPDLGVAGIVLVVLYVGHRMLSAERDYFQSERATYRKETRTDMAELKAEVAALKAENRELEERLNAQWRARGARHHRDGGDGGVSPPA